MNFNYLKYELEHARSIEEFERLIEAVYNAAIKEGIRIAKGLNIDADIPFSFIDYPESNKLVKEWLLKLAHSLNSVITKGVESGWLLANTKNNAFVEAVFANRGLSPDQISQFMPRNLEALKVFQGRKEGGMKLSDRVWKYTNQFKTEIELAIDLGIDGRSANQISREVRGFLQEPNKLFRRVRDKRGNLQLSKAAKAYNPGQGVYRSSYKNAIRMTGTEINLAYRESDYLRNQGFDFVVGQEIKRSNRKFECDVCESLKGKYPKNFKFRGWHPNCRCYMIAILMSDSEFEKYIDSILNDTPHTFQSKNQVKSPPKGFNDFIDKNEKRILKASKLPYWIQDNNKEFSKLKFTLK